MKINEDLKKYSLIPKRYTKKNKSFIIDTNKGKFVYKNSKPKKEILDYLKTRNFDYIPKYITKSFDNYQITEYLENYNIPKEQKILDMINLVSLLHSKTTHYKEIDINEYEKIYEEVINNIDYLRGYYTDLITIIESKVYPSPSEYLLERNISIIFGTLNSLNERLEKFNTLITNKKTDRNVILHNNLKLDHFIRNNKSYLINWDYAKIGNPIFDIYKLYKNHVSDFDFLELLKAYEKNYPLKDDEKELLFILISLPDKIEFNDNEYEMCKKISKFVDELYKTNNFTKTI